MVRVPNLSYLSVQPRKAGASCVSRIQLRHCPPSFQSTTIHETTNTTIRRESNLC